MAVKVPETKELGGIAQDGLAIVIAGICVGALKEVGAVVSYLLTPSIAKTDDGKTFLKYLSILLFVDALLERVSPKGVM